jgi:hypothetical protein
MSSYETGKLTYTSQEWGTLSRQEQQHVMTAQREHQQPRYSQKRREPSRHQHKQTRLRLLAEATQETMSAMPVYAELKRRYDAASAVLQNGEFNMEMQLAGLGIKIHKEVVRGLGYGDVDSDGGCPDQHNFQDEIPEEEIHLDFVDKYQEKRSTYGMSIPTNDELDQEHEKLVAFATALTERRKAISQARAGYCTLTHEYKEMKTVFDRSVETLYREKIATESQSAQASH